MKLPDKLPPIYIDEHTTQMSGEAEKINEIIDYLQERYETPPPTTVQYTGYADYKAEVEKDIDNRRAELKQRKGQ